MTITTKRMDTLRMFTGLSTDPRPGLTENDAGCHLVLTDRRQILVWDGDAWMPFSGGRIVIESRNVYAQRTSVNGAGDTTAVALASVRIPAVLLHVNAAIRMYSVWRYPNSANAKKLRHYSESTQMFELSVTTTVNAGVVSWLYWNGAMNVGAVPQFNGDGGSSSTAPVAVTDDYSIDRTVSFSCAWGGATLSETITLDRYAVEVMV